MNDMEGMFVGVAAVFVIYYLLRIVFGAFFNKGHDGYHPDK